MMAFELDTKPRRTWVDSLAGGVKWLLMILGAIALIAGILHQLSYVTALLAQHLGDVPGAVAIDPVEPVIIGVYIAGAVLLWRGGRS